MAKKPVVSIIIVNWNGLNHLKDCFESIGKTDLSISEIIVVDNNSTDDSVIYLRELQQKLPNLVIIENEDNLGYAEGNNVGVAQANGQYILFLNNDIIIENDFLTPLVNILDNDVSIAAVQPKIMQAHDRRLIDSVGSYFISSGFLYHLGHNKPDNKQFTKPSDIFSMKGACMLFRSEVLQQIGVFDSDYFAYFEETDLCIRTWLSGYRIRYEPSAVIYHKGGETSKKLPSAFVQYHAYKNRIYTYLKNFETVTLLKILPQHLLLCLFISLLYCAKLQFTLAWAIIRAIFWNTTKITALRKQRKHIADLRQKHDSDYLPQVTRKVRPSYYYHLFTTSLRGYDDGLE